MLKHNINYIHEGILTKFNSFTDDIKVQRDVKLHRVIMYSGCTNA